MAVWKWAGSVTGQSMLSAANRKIPTATRLPFPLVNRDKEDGITAHARSEIRLENSTHGTRNQNGFLFAGGVGVKTSDDWRLLTNINAVLSKSRSRETSFNDTDYVETSIGYAYRPVKNDRLNYLFKYTWL